MNCHNCNKAADWVIQSPSLAYWYCKDCKLEPIELPTLEEVSQEKQQHLFDDMGSINSPFPHIRYVAGKGFEYSVDGVTWQPGTYDGDADDDDDFMDIYNPFDNSLTLINDEMALFTKFIKNGDKKND